MTDSRVSFWYRLGVKLLVAVLAVSGFAQMPIFKRYYIADIPGLGWLAQFYTTHIVHYVAAAIFLALMGYVLARYFLQWKRDFRLRSSAWPRIFLFAVIIGTGALRVAKNLPDVHFDPTTTMLLDWVHLFAVIILGLVALPIWIVRRSGYLQPR